MIKDVMAILDATARATGFDVAKILSNSREHSCFRTRSAAIYIARLDTGASFPELGKLFNRHHSTIIAAFRVYSQLVDAGDRHALELIKRIRDERAARAGPHRI
jgi:chromosomal replication initiation ATPase DnaA